MGKAQDITDTSDLRFDAILGDRRGRYSTLPTDQIADRSKSIHLARRRLAVLLSTDKLNEFNISHLYLKITESLDKALDRLEEGNVVDDDIIVTPIKVIRGDHHGRLSTYEIEVDDLLEDHEDGLWFAMILATGTDWNAGDINTGQRYDLLAENPEEIAFQLASIAVLNWNRLIAERELSADEMFALKNAEMIEEQRQESIAIIQNNIQELLEQAEIRNT